MNRYVWANLRRNLDSSWRTYGMSAALAAIAFTLCGGVFLIHRNLVLTTQYWAASVPVTLILDPNADAQTVATLQERARAEGATATHLVTPEEGKQRIEASLGGVTLLAGFDENPLPPVLELRFARPPSSSQVALMRAWPGVAEVDDAARWSGRFRSLLRSVERMGGGLAILLTIASAGVLGLAVRLAAASHATELEIQRLIGAPETFVLAPYLLAGALTGALSAGLALVILRLAFRAAVRAAENLPIPIHAPEFLTTTEGAAAVVGGFTVGLLAAWIGLGKRSP